MHGFELQRHIERFFAGSEKFQPFFTVIAELAGSAEGLTGHLEKISKGGQGQNEGAAHIYNHLAGVHQKTSTVSQRQFFKALDHFQATLSEFHPAQFNQIKLLAELVQEIEEFSAIYDTFITRGSPVNALPVILAAQALFSRLQMLLCCFELFDELIGNHDIAGSSEEPLTLWLPAHFDLSGFARRLQAVQTLYSELCMLLSISEHDHPLRISKIESGSLWAKFFGESRVIGLIASFVEQAALWMYRNHTAEGKITSVSMKIEAVDAMLELTARLKEAGLQTEGMDAHIEKSAFVISRDLAILLDGQSSITVNEKVISASTEHNRPLLGPATLHLLESSSLTDAFSGKTPPDQ